MDNEYKPSNEVSTIVRRFAAAKRHEAWASMQQALIEHYRPTMTGATAKRADRTLQFLRAVVSGKELYGRY